MLSQRASPRPTLTVTTSSPGRISHRAVQAACPCAQHVLEADRLEDGSDCGARCVPVGRGETGGCTQEKGGFSRTPTPREGVGVQAAAWGRWRPGPPARRRAGRPPGSLVPLNSAHSAIAGQRRLLPSRRRFYPSHDPTSLKPAGEQDRPTASGPCRARALSGEAPLPTYQPPRSARAARRRQSPIYLSRSSAPACCGGAALRAGGKRARAHLLRARVRAARARTHRRGRLERG